MVHRLKGNQHFTSSSTPFEDLKIDILQSHSPLHNQDPATLMADFVSSIASHAINTNSLISDFGLPRIYPFIKFKFQLGERSDETFEKMDNDRERLRLASRFFKCEITSMNEVECVNGRSWRLESKDDTFNVAVSDDKVRVTRDLGKGVVGVTRIPLVSYDFLGAVNIYQQSQQPLNVPDAFSLRSLYSRVNSNVIEGARVDTVCLGMKPTKNDECTSQPKHWVYQSHPEKGDGTVPKTVCTGHVETDNPVSVSAKYHLITQDEGNPFLFIYPIQYNSNFEYRDRDMLIAAVGLECARSLGVKNIATPDIGLFERPGEIRFTSGAMLVNKSPELFGENFIQRYQMIHNWLEKQKEFNVFKWDGELPVFG